MAGLLLKRQESVNDSPWLPLLVAAPKDMDATVWVCIEHAEKAKLGESLVLTLRVYLCDFLYVVNQFCFSHRR